MTTENQGPPPGKQNPASSLPQQEKRWTIEEVGGGIMTTFYRLCFGDRVLLILSGFDNKQVLQDIADAHNATLSEPKESEEEKQ